MTKSFNLKEKLSAVLFLNVKTDVAKSVFNTNEDLGEELYLPVRSTKILRKVTKNKELDNLSIDLFVEGMFFVIGADENFKYINIYKKLLTNLTWSTDLIKKIIYEEIKNSNIEEAYIMLKGLAVIDRSVEIYDRLLLLCNDIRKHNNSFLLELQYLINRLEKVEGYFTSYLYDAILKKEQDNYEEAYISIDNYIKNTGNTNSDVIDLYNDISDLYNYNKGKELAYSDPKKSLSILLPLLDNIEDQATIYFYVAVAYRNLKNHEKAIYYLNEALSVDSAIVEVFNELGINYSCLEMYNEALKYFRKAFDATKSIEICTNIIMCYMQLGDIQNARLHLDIALKLNPNDELVITFNKLLEEDK